MTEVMQETRQEEAERQARKLREHWERKFPGIKIWVGEKKGNARVAPVYGVRSNLINGLPPK